MIVRDEEAYLDDCLRSIVDEVDEIVIVDTGSRDRTCDIARRYGARLFSFPWTGDFAAARNHALDQASGDWILYIDADERLVVPTAGALRAAVAQPDVVALAVRFQPRANFTPYREIRIFRRDPRIRFRGVIHETMRPDLHTVLQTDGMALAVADVGITHVGYDGEMIGKYRRNLPLLEAAVKKTPDRVFLWTDMAEALAGLGRNEEAARACRRAIELAEASQELKQRHDAVPAWRRLIALSAAEPAEAVALARRALALYPLSHSLQYDLARALFAAGRTDELFPIVDALTAIDPETFSHPIVAYDKRIFGEWAFDLKGAAHARRGHRAEAAAAFARAAALAPDNLAYRAKATAFAAANASPARPPG
ncbi:MAG: glycosyltransferase [Xanthobacteraceae bacterium]|nr:glycosyltransferase [Xanthobacteraceae bacterium]